MTRFISVASNLVNFEMRLFRTVSVISVFSESFLKCCYSLSDLLIRQRETTFCWSPSGVNLQKTTLA